MTRISSAVESSFGSYDIWKTDFVSVGKMRGVGWAICYQDPLHGRLSNHWITLHEVGNVAGFIAALVMDVWEHAFLLDYKPAERPKYIEAFFSNIDWETVEERLSAVFVTSPGVPSRGNDAGAAACRALPPIEMPGARRGSPAFLASGPKTAL